jgi:hypothetical protein
MTIYPAQEEIRWKDVDSSNVRKVGWDRDGNMYVLFRDVSLEGRNTLYMYRGVTRQRVVAASRAKSVGRYLNQHIKPHHDAVRIR